MNWTWTWGSRVSEDKLYELTQRSVEAEHNCFLLDNKILKLEQVLEEANKKIKTQEETIERLKHPSMIGILLEFMCFCREHGGSIGKIVAKRCIIDKIKLETRNAVAYQDEDRKDKAYIGKIDGIDLILSDEGDKTIMAFVSEGSNG